MVAHLVKLRFLILANSLKKSPWQLVAVIIAALYGLGLLIAIVAGLIVLGFAPLEIIRSVTVVAGAATIFGWIVLPLVTSGIDQTVEPSRLVMFPIPINTLLLGLTVSGVLGVAGIVTSIAAVATVGSWARYPVAAVAALVCAAIAVLTAVVGSRMMAALSANLGSGRRFREAQGLIVFVPLLLLGPIIIAVTEAAPGLLEVLPTIAAILEWTPIGAAWAVPGSIASGGFGAAVLQFVIALVTLGVFVVIWRFALVHALENPAHTATSKAGKGGLGFFGVFPGTPTGAVAARALTYWLRDPRYAQSLITIPLAPVALAFYANLNGVPGVLNAAGPIVAFLLALSIYTDVSYDNTAFALHLQTGVSGAADRLGRVFGLMAFALPVTVLITVGTVWFTNTWQVLPGLLGIAIGALLSGAALSSVVSGRFAFAVPLPGKSPFKSPPGAGVGLTLSLFATWSGLTILVIPETVLAIIGFVTGDAIWGWASLLVALVLGGILLVIGVRRGGAILDRRGPEMFALLQAKK
jgi:ABC-2 type transport system permease protein